MIITIIGLGYVGTTHAILFSRRHTVHVLDKYKKKTDALLTGTSPIDDPKTEELLKSESLHLSNPDDHASAFADSDFIIIATNTPTDPKTGMLDTSSIEWAMKYISSYSYDRPPVIILKSTVPIGFTKELSKRYPGFTILYCPEFLREKTAMDDVLNPSRIVIGYDKNNENDKNTRAAAELFAETLKECSEKTDVPVIFTNTSEAEAIKLFSNSYLALRLSFFNELDSFATVNELDSRRIINGVCLDPRIGDFYNEPGPGFGGHCLPKDTLQLIKNFDSSELPEFLVRAAIDENEHRREFTTSHSDQQD